MPRTIQEILDHGDELAKKFEDSDPSDGTERPISEYLLQRAALARARTERQIVEAVEAARVQIFISETEPSAAEQGRRGSVRSVPNNQVVQRLVQDRVHLLHAPQGEPTGAIGTRCWRTLRR